jgi:hypothetical protein
LKPLHPLNDAESNTLLLENCKLFFFFEKQGVGRSFRFLSVGKFEARKGWNDLLQVRNKEIARSSVFQHPNNSFDFAQAYFEAFDVRSRVALWIRSKINAGKDWDEYSKVLLSNRSLSLFWHGARIFCAFWYGRICHYRLSMIIANRTIDLVPICRK